MTVRRKIMSITFPLTVFLYLTICLFGKETGWCGNEIWGEALPIFVINIIMPFILGYWKFKFSASLIITLVYLIIGFVSTYAGNPLWHPAWVIFILIPVFEICLSPTKKSPKAKNKQQEYKFTYNDESKDDSN